MTELEQAIEYFRTGSHCVYDEPYLSCIISAASRAQELTKHLDEADALLERCIMPLHGTSSIMSAEIDEYFARNAEHWANRVDEYDALKTKLQKAREFITQERNDIFYAMTRGREYNIGLAKERMTNCLNDLGGE